MWFFIRQGWGRKGIPPLSPPQGLFWESQFAKTTKLWFTKKVRDLLITRKFNSVAPTTPNNNQKADLDYHPDRLKLFVFILTFAIKTLIIVAIRRYAQRRRDQGSWSLFRIVSYQLLCGCRLFEKSLSVRTRWAFSYFVVIESILTLIHRFCKSLLKISWI